MVLVIISNPNHPFWLHFRQLSEVPLTRFSVVMFRMGELSKPPITSSDCFQGFNVPRIYTMATAIGQ